MMRLKDFTIFSFCSLVIVSFAGCVVRTYPKTIERVDLKVEGNQGYLLGTPKEGEVKEQKTTRTIQILEVEVGAPIKVLKEEPKAVEEKPRSELQKTDTELWGNLGNIQTSISTQSQDVSSLIEEGVQVTTFDTYRVQKNDTLQKIAARPEIYGTTKKWKKLYEANKDNLSSPDKIYPGQSLKIPRD